jgi:hypothetical protein
MRESDLELDEGCIGRGADLNYDKIAKDPYHSNNSLPLLPARVGERQILQIRLWKVTVECRGLSGNPLHFLRRDL